MSSDQLTNITLEDLLDFNEQLLLLDRAGLPIAIDGQPNDEELAGKLSRIASHVALQMGRNRSLPDALTDATIIPRHYARALKTWISSDKHPSALEVLVRPAEALAARRSDVAVTLIQPLVLLTLVYAGTLFLVWRVAPIMEEMFRESRTANGPFLNVLIFIRETRLIWMIGFPIVVIGSVWLWQLRSHFWQYSWVPGSQFANRSVEQSALVDSLASCLSTGQELPAAYDQLATETTSSTTPTSSAALPPLVHWALSLTPTESRTGQMPEQSQVLLLRSVARVYRGRASALASRWRRWLPLMIGTLLGGLIVLPYGLLLFGPMIELLLEICQPRKVG